MKEAINRQPDKDKMEPEEGMPTDSEIDQAIVDLEIRSEEISRGGNADILLEEDPE